MSLFTRIRLSRGLLWKRNYWLPSKDNVKTALGVALLLLLLYTSIWIILAAEREQEALGKQAQAEQMFLDCLNDRLILTTQKHGIRCKPMEIKL